MQAVPELMQECLHFVESQQSRFAFGWLGEVHHYRYMRSAVFTGYGIYPLFLVTGHPGSGAFSGTGMEVSVQYGQELAVFVEYLVGFNIFVINRDFRIFPESDSVESFCQSEYSFFYLFQFEVRTEHFFINIEFLVFQFIGIVAPVPGHDNEVITLFLTCQFLYFEIFFLCGGSVGFQ